MTKPRSQQSEPSPDSSLPCTDSLGTDSLGTDGPAPQGQTPIAAKRGRPSIEEAQRLPLRILEAGWDVLREHGFEAFTFDRVARHARIGKATIYSRYAGKREFLEALLAHKAVERRLKIMKVGAGLPLVEAFCQRAAAVMHVLHSTEGRMMERLVDWCDQEFGNDEVNYRHAMFLDALTNITSELRNVAKEQKLLLHEPEQVARFWLEGILGHARLKGEVGEIDAEANERWARAYSEFFFAALRSSSRLSETDEQP